MNSKSGSLYANIATKVLFTYSKIKGKNSEQEKWQLTGLPLAFRHHLFDTIFKDSRVILHNMNSLLILGLKRAG